MHPFDGEGLGIKVTAQTDAGPVVDKLFADAEAGEDAPEQVIGTESSGNFAQGLLCLAKVFGQQLTGAGQGQL
ncbi:hypothetical protein D9M73_241990 [compost metagenome]